MKKLIYTCLLFLGLTLSLTAQVTVKGIVLGEGSEPIIGATIMVGEGNMGTVSEFDGSFELGNMKAGAQTMTISYISYSDVEQTLNLVDGMNDLGEITMEISSIGLHIFLLCISRRPEKQNVQMRGGLWSSPCVTPPG